LEDSGLDGRIILRWIFRKWDDLAQNRDRWWAVVKVVINLWFYKMGGIS
jgi:hypothetical protein